MNGRRSIYRALRETSWKAWCRGLLVEVAALKETVAALRDEIARLKGLNGRPPIKPSGMEGSSGAKRAGRRKTKRRGKGSKRLIIDEDRIVAAAVAPGSRFKGYEDYVVQDLVVRRHVIRFRRERWLTPEGAAVAPLPPGIVGHFRSRAAALRAGAVSPRPGDGAASGDATRRPRDRDLQAASCAACDRPQGGLPVRGDGCAPRRAGDRAVDHGRRHRRPPQGSERRVYPDRQRSLHLVRHDWIEEPAELPGVAARRARRLRDQRRRRGLYAPAQSGAIRRRQAGEPPDPAPWRRGGLARPSRSPRGRRVQGAHGGGEDCHRRRHVGQHHRPRPAHGCGDRQRRRPVSSTSAITRAVGSTPSV